MAVLRSQTGDNRTFPLRCEETVIGRDLSCDITIDGAQEQCVSRRHARVFPDDGGYFIEDLGSLNGTYVNGDPIRTPTRLCTGDVIGIGELKILFDGESGFEEEPAGAIDTAAIINDRNEANQASIINDRNEADRDSIIASLNARDFRLSAKPEAKLRTLLEISRKLRKSLDMDDVLPKVLESLFAIFPQADHCCIALRDQSTGRLVTIETLCRPGMDGESFTLSQTIIDHVVSTRQAVIRGDVQEDSQFGIRQSVVRAGIRSIMCVPMLSQTDDVLGIIQLDSRSISSRFEEEDLDLILCASTQAAHGIELATMYEEQRDLEAAAKIQESFLPTTPPSCDSIWFFQHYEAARDIGGDYYDYVEIPGNRLAVALGDVSGKGASAALLMAKLSSAARFCLLDKPQVADAVCRLNDSFLDSGERVRFVTFVVVVLDLNDFSMTLVNAGHIPPLCWRSRSGEVEELGTEAGGLALGLAPEVYQEIRVSLNPGDTVVLCTDGVTEARAPNGDLYGVERLRTVFATAAAKHEEVGPAILRDVRMFSASRPPSDDIALVCFGRADPSQLTKVANPLQKG